MSGSARTFFSPETRRDPYPYYRMLRHTNPVLHLDGFGWMVSRRDDVFFILSRPDLFSSSVMAKADVALLGNDPPSHTAVRRIANRLFSAERVLAQEANIRAAAESLTASISGEWDLVNDFAVPFPLLAMAQMLGIDPRIWPQMKRWSEAVVSANTGLRPRRELADDKAIAEFDLFFLRKLESSRRSPGDDAIGALLRLRSAGEELTEEQILSLSKLLLIAGGETTTNLIGNAALALLRNSDQLDCAAADPSLIPALTEETLRYDSPVQFVIRVATREVVLAENVLAGGARVIALLGSANRDEQFFFRPRPVRYPTISSDKRRIRRRCSPLSWRRAGAFRGEDRPVDSCSSA